MNKTIYIEIFSVALNLCLCAHIAAIDKYIDRHLKLYLLQFAQTFINCSHCAAGVPDVQLPLLAQTTRAPLPPLSPVARFAGVLISSSTFVDARNM